MQPWQGCDSSSCMLVLCVQLYFALVNGETGFRYAELAGENRQTLDPGPRVRSAKCGMGISNMPWCFLAIAFQPCSQLQQMPLVCRAIRSAWGNPSLRQQRVFPEGSQLVSKVFQSAAKSAACMSASATHDTASVATSLGISNAPPLATVGGGHSECMCMSCMKQ